MRRLGKCTVLGLTGSIAMGKTTVAGQFKALGVPALDSDKVVHALFAADPEVHAFVKNVFPQALKNKTIDRAEIGRQVFASPEKLAQLEAVLHPKVREAQEAFIRAQKAQGKNLVLLDIPLLFETHGERRCDYTVTVSAPAFLQRQRALKRDGMSEQKLKRILARQMPDAEKRRRADFVVHTGLGKAHSLRQALDIIRKISS